MFCALCGQHARHPKSPETELRRKECPRFTTSGASIPAVVHRGCCAKEVCSDTDGRGHVRCAWAHGGRERVLAMKAGVPEAGAPGEESARGLDLSA